jgi:hypothetical protein
MNFVLYEGDIYTRGTYAVIPDRDVVRFPFEPHLELVVLADLSEEEVQYCVRLGFGHTHYVPREACSLTQDRKRCRD